MPLLAALRTLLFLGLCLPGAALQAAEPLRVGIYQNPPKVFSNTQGSPAGFFVDILTAIARQEGWQLDYVPCEWEACLRSLEQGDIDLMPDVAYSPERDRRFDFNREVVLSNWSLLYARAHSTIHSLLDLDGRRIAVLDGSIQYSVLKKRIAEFDLEPAFLIFNSPEETLRAVAEGSADAALVNRLYGLLHAQDYGLEPTHILIESSHIYYATAQGRHAALLSTIDAHLREMKGREDSPYYLALTRWVEPLETKTFPLWPIWLAEGLFALLLALGLHNFILKRAVQRSTRELQQRNADLAESETMFRTLFETSSNAMLLSRDGLVIDANPAMLHMLGYPDLEALQGVNRDGIFPPQQPDGQNSHNAAENLIHQAFEGAQGAFEWIHRRADGSTFPSEVTLVPMVINRQQIIQATIRDLSQLKQDESHLRNLNRALQTLSRVNHILVHARDEAGLLEEICRVIVEVGGYRLAWVGFAQYDDARSVLPVAQFGFEQGYLDNLRISWQDDEYGRGPTGTAIRTAKPFIVRDIHNDHRFAPWREQAEQRGYASSIGLPLIGDGRTFGALSIYSAEPDAFNDEELELLVELAADLAFGINTQRMHFEHTQLSQEREGHKERLQNSLLQTIQAITIMLEKRDPYTAGHQRRSTDLAVAVAEEMHLDPVRIEGIRFGTMIHDIGNIYVPAEILNRPGKLSGSELNIVRSHAQVGYDIVKEIDFPWPVAQMILQHHERLDGSGYPTGLKGDEILLEARIIAVVDVIEAMLSHRPYRPALGLESALQELREHRGTRYDARVVDAALRLFNEKGYVLPA